MTEPDKPESVIGFEPEQLAGFRIGVTSDRRSADLIAAFERRGAEVLHAPTLRIVPAQEDARLIEDTKTVIDTRPDVLLATTAYGMRGWFEAADAAGWARRWWTSCRAPASWSAGRRRAAPCGPGASPMPG